MASKHIPPGFEDASTFWSRLHDKIWGPRYNCPQCFAPIESFYDYCWMCGKKQHTDEKKVHCEIIGHTDHPNYYSVDIRSGGEIKELTPKEVLKIIKKEIGNKGD